MRCCQPVVQAIERRVFGLRRALLGHKVWGVENHEIFVPDPQVEGAWAELVPELVERHCFNMARCTTSGFLRARLGPALTARGVAPHFDGTVDDARRRLRHA